MNPSARFMVLPGLLLSVAVAQAETAQQEIFSKGGATWASLTEDTGAGAVAAAGMLGMAGDSVATVENVKGLVASLKGLNVGGSKGALALGITPARTSFAPMNLSTYAGYGSLNATVARILGSTTVGYAQGQSQVSAVDYDRRALSVQTTWFLRASDDPVLAVAEAAESCKVFDSSKPKPAAPTAVTPGPAGAAAKPAEVDPAESKARFADCTKKAIANLRWNRSLASLSVARGWIRRSDGSAPELSMGTALTANLTLGFNPAVGWFDQGLALTLGYRHTRNEPVLATLANAAPERRRTQLALVRVTGGSDESRLFAELSNARREKVTESQRAFKYAVGIDTRLMPDVWLNLRLGKQRTITGEKLETASLLSLSWSPKALMNVGTGP
ncbi:hypothetical protein [Roseateles sp. P5_D6]